LGQGFRPRWCHSAFLPASGQIRPWRRLVATGRKPAPALACLVLSFVNARSPNPPEPLQGEGLTLTMAVIGMDIASRADAGANIEETVLAASAAGMEQEDYRVLSVLVTWLETHSAWINLNRPTHLVLGHPSLTRSSRPQNTGPATGRTTTIRPGGAALPPHTSATAGTARPTRAP
jgi:hypothetical protein